MFWTCEYFKTFTWARTGPAAKLKLKKGTGSSGCACSSTERCTLANYVIRRIKFFVCPKLVEIRDSWLSQGQNSAPSQRRKKKYFHPLFGHRKWGNWMENCLYDSTDAAYGVANNFVKNSCLMWRIAFTYLGLRYVASVAPARLLCACIIFIRRIWWRRRREEKLRHFSLTKLQAIWHSSRILKSFSLHFLRRCESQMPNMEANGWNRRKNANVEIVYSSDINIWFSIVLLARFTFILNIFTTFRIWLRKLHT